MSGVTRKLTIVAFVLAGFIASAGFSARAADAADRGFLDSVVNTLAGGNPGDGSGDAKTVPFTKLSNGIARDPAGNIILLENQRVLRITPARAVTVVAGSSGIAGYRGDGALAAGALFKNPTYVTVDGASNIFVVDAGNNRIRKITAADGSINTVAGNGNTAGGLIADVGRLAVDSRINGAGIVGIVVDGTGQIFFADSGTNVIYKVGTDGLLSVVAGSGVVTAGGPLTLLPGTSKNGVAALGNPLNGIRGLALLGNGDLVYTEAGAVRQVKVTSDGSNVVIAGALDSAGNVLITRNAIFPDNGSKAAVQIEAAGPAGPSAGGVPEPRSVAVDGNNIVFWDGQTQRFRQFAIGGNIGTVFGEVSEPTVGAGFRGDNSPAATSTPRPGIVITRGLNGILDSQPKGDDIVIFDQQLNQFVIGAGANGIAETPAAGDDVQVVPVGTAGVIDDFTKRNDDPKAAVGGGGVVAAGGVVTFVDFGNKIVRQFTVGGNVNTFAGAFLPIRFQNTADNTPQIVSNVSATATVGTAFSFTLVANNGATTFTDVNAILPTLGLTLNGGNGQISGIPTVPGTFTIPFTATNGVGTGMQAFLTLTINPAANLSALTSAAAVAGTQGRALLYVITGSNTPGNINVLDLTALPPGVGFDGVNTICGVPNQNGVFPVPIALTNSKGTTNTNVTFNIAAPAGAANGTVFTNATLSAAGTEEQAFSFTLTASNPAKFASSLPGAIPGVLTVPGGLVLNTNTGVVSGVLKANGVFPIQVTATGPGGPARSTFTITSAPIPFAPVVTSPASALGIVGTPFLYQATATNTANTLLPFAATGLPALGLSFVPASGQITGIPTGPGQIKVGITATNTNGVNGANLVGYEQVVITINPSPRVPVFTGPLTLNATQGKALPNPNAVPPIPGAVFLVGPSFTNCPTTFTDEGGLLGQFGLTLDTATGEITGTPTSNGTLAEAISATNAFGKGFGTLNLNITAVAGAPVVTNATFNLTQGTAFNGAITATGTPTSFSAIGLPTGISINPATGALTGTPNIPNGPPCPPIVAEVTATNATGSGFGQLTFNVAPSATLPTITSALTATVAVNTPLVYTITGANGANMFCAYNLPFPLVFSGATISGTPTTIGNFPVIITASNTSGILTQTVSNTLLISVTGANLPVITSALTATGTVNAPFNYSITATNLPITFTATLPLGLGLKFDPTTGKIFGTPLQTGTFFIPISATNNAAPPQTGNAILQLTVGPATNAPVITSSTVVTGQVGKLFLYQIIATNGANSFSVVSGAVPGGLVFDPLLGQISGTPTAAGSSVITLGATATNSQTSILTGQLTIQIVIDAAAPVPPSANGNLLFAQNISDNAPVPAKGAAIFSPNRLGKDATGNLFFDALDFYNDRKIYKYDINAKTLTVVAGPVFINGSVVNTGDGGSAKSTGLKGLGAQSGVASDDSFFFADTDLSGGGSTNTIRRVDAGGNISTVGGIPRVGGANQPDGDPNALAGNGSPAPTTARIGQKGTAVTFKAPEGVLPLNTTDFLVADTQNSSLVLVAGGNVTQDLLLDLQPTYLAQVSGSVFFTASRSGLTGAPIIGGILNVTASINAPFTYQILASPAATGFTATGLPPGLVINPGTGLITGSPAATGIFPVVIKATNASGTGQATLTITVNPLGPAITSAATATGTFGTPFTNFQIVAVGATSFSASGLPGGLIIDPVAGLISGTPSAVGVFNVTVTASNANGTTTSILTITINPQALVGQITSVTLPLTVPTGREGSPFTGTVNTSGTFSTLTVTGLPAGLSCDPLGNISGIPNPGSAGAYNVNAVMLNAAGIAISSSTSNITIGKASHAPLVTNAVTLIRGVAGVPIAPFTVTSGSDGVGGATALASSAPPAGIVFTPATGQFTGTPAAAGVTVVNVTASNTLGSFTVPMTINIVPNTFPAITSALVLNATQGTTIPNYQITASGAPFIAIPFAAAGLPAGLVVNATTGVISGTPTVNGVFNVTLGVTNAAGTGNATLVVTVCPPANTAIVNPPSSAFGPASMVVTATVAFSSFPFGNFAFSNAGAITGFNSPNLPAGVTIDAFGNITGTVAGPGVFPVTINVVNANGTNSVPFTIYSIPALFAPVFVNTATAVSGVNGQNFPSPNLTTAYGINATDSAAGVFTITAGALPAGLAINAATGAITGIPAALGPFPQAFPITVSLNNGTGPAITINVTITILNGPTAPIITSGLGGLALTQGTATTAATQYTITAAPAATSFSANVTSAGTPFQTPANPPALVPTGAVTLPPGLTLNTATGVISGTPTQNGTFLVDLIATNAAGSSIEQFTITVAPFPTAMTITSGAVLNVQAAVAFTPATYRITNSINNANPANGTTYAATGLPAGITVDPNGFLTGTPAAAGIFVATISSTVTDGTNKVTASATLTITVNNGTPIAPGTPVIVSPLAITVTQGTPFVYQTRATDVFAPTTFTLAIGPPSPFAPPPPPPMNPVTGVITGTPLVVGVYNFDITVTNAARNATARLVVTVNPANPPVVTSATTVFGREGQFLSFPVTASNNPNFFGAVGLPLGLGIATNTTFPTGTGGLQSSVGLISGIPAAGTAGFFTVTLTAANGTGPGTQLVTFLISSPKSVPIITTVPATIGSFTQGAAVSVQLTATDNPTSFCVDPTRLPPGLTLSMTGLLSGTPTTSGIFGPMPINAANANGNGPATNFTFVVNPNNAIRRVDFSTVPPTVAAFGPGFSNIRGIALGTNGLFVATTGSVTLLDGVSGATKYTFNTPTNFGAVTGLFVNGATVRIASASGLISEFTDNGTSAPAAGTLSIRAGKFFRLIGSGGINLQAGFQFKAFTPLAQFGNGDQLVGDDGVVRYFRVTLGAAANATSQVPPTASAAVVAGTGNDSGLTPGQLASVVGLAGEGSPATSAVIGNVGGILVGTDGAVYFSDMSISTVRRVLSAGSVETYAGIPGRFSSAGNGLNRLLATFNSPAGLAQNATGEILIVDQIGHVLRKVKADNTVALVAGTPNDSGYQGDGYSGVMAKFSNPRDVTLDPAGDIYVADGGNSVIRTILPRDIVGTISGNLNGHDVSQEEAAALEADIGQPGALALDVAGKIFSSPLSGSLIYRTAANRCRAVIGIGNTSGFNGDGMPGLKTMLSNPGGLTYSPTGDLDFCDTGNNRLRAASNLAEKTNTPPTAVIVVVPDHLGSLPFKVRLDGSQSFDPDGDIVSYLWDFGDGTAQAPSTGNGIIVEHTYTTKGAFLITLTVTDSAKNVSVATTVVFAASPILSSQTSAKGSFKVALGTPKSGKKANPSDSFSLTIKGVQGLTNVSGKNATIIIGTFTATTVVQGKLVADAKTPKPPKPPKGNTNFKLSVNVKKQTLTVSITKASLATAFAQFGVINENTIGLKQALVPVVIVIDNGALVLGDKFLFTYKANFNKTAVGKFSQ